jgi:hypothetical protein
MTNFADLNIKTVITNFVGNQIKIKKVLGKQIEILAFKIRKSIYYEEKGKPECLYLQIKYDDEKRVIFTSGVKLIADIKEVPEDKFPFNTTIIENEDGMYLFT